MTKGNICDIISTAIGNLGVAQMVARYLGVVEAAGSNPVTQTKYSRTEPCPRPAVFRFSVNVFEPRYDTALWYGVPRNERSEFRGEETPRVKRRGTSNASAAKQRARALTIRRGIEVVITGLTRNQFVLTDTRVRIPPSPPTKKQ